MSPLPDGATEGDTDRDGVLSYAGEWHALEVGFAVGFASVVPYPKLKRFVFAIVGLGADMTRTQAFKEAKRESWYALTGVVLGAVVGLAFQAVALYLGVAVMVP